MRHAHALLLIALLVCAAGAGAAERKVYKHVDEHGNVTYSQTPPVAKDAKAMDIAPAHQGRGGYPASAPPMRGRSYEIERRRQAELDYQRRQNDVREEKTRELKAECVRQRGTDCDNPATLRYLDAQNIPRRH
jgi:hypothetical protein